MAQEEFIRVGTTLYKIVNQPRINGGFVKKRIVWNNETLRQDYGKDFIATVPKYDGFCTVPNHVNYQPVVDKFLNLYEPIGHQPKEGDFVSVFALSFHLIGKRCAEIFQSFTVFPAIEQYLVHHNKQFTCPIGIELTSEVFVGIERNIVLKDRFKEIEECTLTCIALF